ncbi:MAG: hypothetical protein IJQ44_08170 [Bacteroidaceae bacterium]|nr:hypothetical protein [Bacteroidaceae bacterium]
MIKKEDVLARTDGGLRIILDYYPQAEEVVGTKNKFRMRRSERTPSATLRQKAETGLWVVTDFGDDGHEMNAIDVAMKEEGLTFREAVLKLAARYGVSDELKKDVNRPEIREEDARADQQEGEQFYELNESFTPEELRLLGPLVKQEHVDALHWHSVKYWARVKNRRVKYEYSTPDYPIFMRECVIEEAHGDVPAKRFFKIYRPLNYDKAFRFTYYPAGAKPKKYVNGLAELKAAWRKFNADEEATFREDPHNEEKPYKEKKLPEAFICSGERDALCCRSLGYWPLWFNSESYNVDESEMREIRKYVDVLYNIPDIDEAGIRRGTVLALRYNEIHTVWLPQKYMGQFTDMRGKGYKDFRDWMEAKDNQGPKAFRQLLNMATPAKFWVETVNKRTNKTDYHIDTVCLHEFLRLNGFQTLHDEDITATQYVRIIGHVVRRITAKDIREFIISWSEGQYLPREVRNTILNSPKIQGQALESLKEVDLDFRTSTASSQLFFFQNEAVLVTGSGIEEGAAGHYVWEHDVQPHRFKLLDDMFSVTRTKDMEGKDHWDIEVKRPADGKTTISKLMNYVINSSRIYWRKELETNLEDMSEEDAEAYRKAHHFDIAGEGLTPEEIDEQKQNLIAKLFVIGYMLHRYKAPSRSWAPYCMDNKVGQEGECNGRSGKSFFVKSVAQLMKTVKLSGRDPRLMDNPHVFDQVTRHTDLVRIDDCSQFFDVRRLFDSITDDMVINPKNNQSYTLSAEESPKFAFTTNYVPGEIDASMEARLLFVVFSDYYHEAGEQNDYSESRSIKSDFGKDLFGVEYTEDEWNADFNFLLQCCRFYLSLVRENVKLQPPMRDIKLRQYKADMGSSFEDWAATYFAPEGGHLNTLLVREEVFNDFQAASKSYKWTANRFSKALRGFARFNADWLVMNPKEVCNNGTRIIGKNSAGASKEMIYFKTIEGGVRPDVVTSSSVASPQSNDDDFDFEDYLRQT